MFCELHETKWKEFQQTGGKEVRRCKSGSQCDPKNPGLKAILPEDCKYTRCETCRKKERASDKKRREAKRKQNEAIKKKHPDLRKCLICPDSKTYNVNQMGLKKDKTRSDLCKFHYKYQKMQDKIRVRDPEKERERSHEIESRPERKAYKQEWQKQHPDLVYKYYTECRGKQLTENPEKYRKDKAHDMVVWRANNPEKVVNSSEIRNTSPKNKYTSYKLAAINRGYEFEIDLEKFEEIVKMKCYFCKIKDKKYLNGIDRLNNDFGYTEGNIVPCCTICNNMKNTLNESTFILMCAHIAHYHKLGDYDLYPEVFNDYSGTTFLSYKNRAEKKYLDFELSESQFHNIIKKPCYICNRKSTKTHKNGIDRICNDAGYIINNCASCCGDCNYIKKKLAHSILISQCTFIAEHHKDRLSDLRKKWIPSSFIEVNEQKPSQEELKEMQIKRKIDREAKTLASKSPEAIKKKMDEIMKTKGKNIKVDNLIENKKMNNPSDNKKIASLKNEKNDLMDKELDSTEKKLGSIGKKTGLTEKKSGSTENKTGLMEKKTDPIEKKTGSTEKTCSVNNKKGNCPTITTMNVRGRTMTLADDMMSPAQMIFYLTGVAPPAI